MSERKRATTSQPARKRTKIDLEMKMEIITRQEGGQPLSAIAREFGLPFSTISTIVKDSARIKRHVEASAPMGSTIITKRRSGAICEMENELSIWIGDNLQKHVVLSPVTIRSKAKRLYAELMHKYPGTTDNFQASDGWFSRFKKRIGLDEMKISIAGDVDAADKFVIELNKFIKDDNYSEEQIFTAGETGLFWKKMPSSTYLSKEEQTTLGFKASKDRLNLLLCCNALGRCKLKPLLVYHSENPRAFREVSKSDLPVYFRSDVKPWVSKTIFEDWFTNYFVPDVIKYCFENEIPFKILLILDRPHGYSGHFPDLHPNVKIMFTPPKTASLILPMELGLIANFKAYYTKTIFAQAVSTLNEHPNFTLREFWKNYNLYDAVVNVAKAWNEASLTCMIFWKKLCPCFNLSSSDIENYDKFEKVVKEVIEFGQELSLDVDVNDVEGLIEDDGSNEGLDFEENVIDPASVDIPEIMYNDFELKEMEMAFQEISAGLTRFRAMDPVPERYLKVQHAVESVLMCYRKVYDKKKKDTVQLFQTHNIKSE